MKLPTLCLRLGAATALVVLCSASPVHLHMDQKNQALDDTILAQQAGWVHHQTLSKGTTHITLPDSTSHLSLKLGLVKIKSEAEEGEDDDEEEDGERPSVQVLKADADDVRIMKQPSTPPKSLPSDPYAHYIYQEDLSEDDGFRGGRVKGKRTIIVGDIHGSLEGLDKFLRKIKYNGKHDRLIAAGDVVAKGPQSLQVIDRLASLGAKCVRGNHDDKVLRWKGFLNSLSLQEQDEQSLEDDAQVSNVSPRLKKHTIPADLEENSQHHQIAKMMSDKQYKYLVKCPLILTLPKELSWNKRSIHVTHAGIDPRRDIKHQEPWVLFNVRNILHNGTPSRKSKKGKGWADLFNRMHHAQSKQVEDQDNDDNDDDDQEEDGDEEEEGDEDEDEDSDSVDNLKLNHNYMIVYGHDAKRALNVQDWSIGLDTGCVYGRELSGYVVETGKIYSVGCPEVIEGDDDD